jgi:hypothetical protein
MDSACLLREQLLAREISAVEVFEAHLEIIERRTRN